MCVAVVKQKSDILELMYVRFGWKNNVNRIFCQLCIYFARNITNNIITWKYEDLLVQYSALWQAWLATWL